MKSHRLFELCLMNLCEIWLFSSTVAVEFHLNKRTTLNNWRIWILTIKVKLAGFIICHNQVKYINRESDMYRQHRTWIIPFRIQHMASSWQIPVKLNDNIDILCCMFLGDNNWQEGKDWPFIIFILFSETFISVLKGRRKTWKSRSFLESRSLCKWHRWEKQPFIFFQRHKIKQNFPAYVSIHNSCSPCIRTEDL